MWAMGVTSLVWYFSQEWIFSRKIIFPPFQIAFPPFQIVFPPQVLDMFAWSASPTKKFCSICLTLSLLGYLKTRERWGGGSISTPFPSSKSRV